MICEAKREYFVLPYIEKTCPTWNILEQPISYWADYSGKPSLHWEKIPLYSESPSYSRKKIFCMGKNRSDFLEDTILHFWKTYDNAPKWSKYTEDRTNGCFCATKKSSRFLKNHAAFGQKIPHCENPILHNDGFLKNVVKSYLFS